MHVDYVTAQEKLLASKLLMSGPYLFVRERAISLSGWTVRVAIRIAKNGSLAGLTLEEPSNSAELIRAACRAIQNAFPSFAPPAELINSVHRAGGYVLMNRWLRFHHPDATIVGAYVPYEVLDVSRRISCYSLLNPP